MATVSRLGLGTNRGTQPVPGTSSHPYRFAAEHSVSVRHACGGDGARSRAVRERRRPVRGAARACWFRASDTRWERIHGADRGIVRGKRDPGYRCADSRTEHS